MNHFLECLKNKDSSKNKVGSHIALSKCKENIEMADRMCHENIENDESDVGWKKKIEDSHIEPLIACLRFKDDVAENSYDDQGKKQLLPFKILKKCISSLEGTDVWNS